MQNAGVVVIKLGRVLEGLVVGVDAEQGRPLVATELFISPGGLSSLEIEDNPRMN